ncbi:FHA domain-containing protein [Propionivibrio limicola]|uniref:FHA domain-containing protein n=1 Tax=Propionivibrio limicola TaxID=167645 RepID=UPI0012924FC5|nr:FHA domain-containing protein [Propionivibrio limicola]
MAKLVLSMDGLVLKEIALDKERMTIGRKPVNDIQIDNLAISGEHAVIVTILDDSFLEDLNSTNGTQVNGQAVKKRQLMHEDVVSLGKYKLKYLIDEPTPDEIHGASTDFTDAATTAKNAQPAGASIHILNGKNAGRSVELTKPQTTLGKPGVQVGVISRLPGGYQLSRLPDLPPPLLNDRPLGDHPAPLSDRDIIEIAGVRMEFTLKR